MNNNDLSTPVKAVKSKIPKPNIPMTDIKPMEEEKNNEMKEISQVFATVMKKLEKLDNIETDMKEIKKSLEYAHEKIDDLKKENELMKREQIKAGERIDALERDKKNLHDKVTDLQARSMRDNLLFFNIPEEKDENPTDLIHELLEKKLEIKDAQYVVKIDRAHRIGRKKAESDRPRPIVVKFNWHQDKEFVRRNAKKLKGNS